MRVAIIQQHVDLERGGAETSTVEMARHLAQLDVDVTVICRSQSLATFVDQGVTFVPIVAQGLTRALQTYRFVQGAGRVCRRGGYDIVHAVTPCLFANVYQPRGGTYAETVERTLALVRDPTWRELKRLGRRFNISQRFLYRIEQTLLGKYRQRVFVAAVSEYVRQQVVEGLRFPAERVRVVFNGIDVQPLDDEERALQRASMRRALGLADEAPLALFVAHNFKLKGLAELIRALAIDIAGDGPAWTLAVAGRDEPRTYARLARRLGLAARVRFVGTNTPVQAWYAAADVLAHPTWYDPCSRVVLEALSVGLPVVTTRYNGAAEVMESGRHGEVIAEPADATELAAALQRAARPAVRVACRADAARMCEQLSMARHARELLSFYRYVLAAQR